MVVGDVASWSMNIDVPFTVDCVDVLYTVRVYDAAFGTIGQFAMNVCVVVEYVKKTDVGAGSVKL